MKKQAANQKLSISVQDKNLEIHYNEKMVNTPSGLVHIRLQGKISCPLLNCKISSVVCARFMDTKGWPREIDSCICDKLDCYISKSIQKNMNKGGKNAKKSKNKK